MTWQKNIEHKARILHDQISGMRALAIEHGTDPEAASAPYYKLLNELYENDLPLARVLDSSDLVLRAEGPAAEYETPRLQVLTGLFSDLRTQVQQISKALAGLGDSPSNKPFGVEIGLTGLAKGSVILGIRLQRPGEYSSGEQLQFPSYNEALFDSTRDAVRKLASITRYVSDEGLDDEAITELIPDPAARDIILTAVHKLSPTGRRGVDKVTLSTFDTAEHSHSLTSKSRKILSLALAHPVKEQLHNDFSGVVREIDLDARRFEIRKIGTSGVLRVVYSSEVVKNPKELLDAHIRVSGKVAMDARGRPRLMMLEEYAVLSLPEKNQDLFDEDDT